MREVTGKGLYNDFIIPENVNFIKDVLIKLFRENLLSII